MHELGITENIVAIAVEYAEGLPVKQVTLEIGQLSAIMPDAIRFCFDVCCQGTCLLYTSPSPRDGLLSRMPSSA